MSLAQTQPRGRRAPAAPAIAVRLGVRPGTRAVARLTAGGLAVACAAAAVAAAGCGSAPLPRRGVIESNLDDWKYRRFQELRDVEVWVPNNPAVAYTASYVRDRAEKAGRLRDGDVVSAVVTRYERDEGIERAVARFARRLAQDSGYQVELRAVDGERVVSVKGRGEAWALWAASSHVIKIGGRRLDRVPKSLIEAYVDRYPSRLRGGVLEGPLPPGDDGDPGDDEGDDDGDEAYDSAAPTPDWDEYDPEPAE